MRHISFKPADWSEELSITGLAAGQKLMGIVESLNNYVMRTAPS